MRSDLAEAHARLRLFLDGNTDEMRFVHPTGHPALDSGFCYCNQSVQQMLGVWFRGALFKLVLRLPVSGLKVRVLRACGAKIGRDVYISEGVWIDPVFPQLLTIEDQVLIGIGARIVLHEFRRDEFCAGKVILRRGSLIGGWATLGCGVEVGADATVAPAAVVGRDVPAGYIAIGNPARILPGRQARGADA
jgi:acetyltransferase-like isoleucine patch superfamily enzyme